MFNAVKNAYLFYEEKMQENNLLDFDDLIINTIKVFEKDATMVEK
jgi:superfamily I DNA/RNA helicase